MTRPIALALTVAAVLWSVLILAAPVALTRPPTIGPAGVLYAACSRICHQRAERSFAISGFKMPVCARCTGLYLSGAVGALLGWMSRPRRPPQHTRWLLAMAAIPTAVTFTLEFAGVMPFSNAARAVAALPLGAAGGWVFVRMLRYDSRFDGNEILNS